MTAGRWVRGTQDLPEPSQDPDDVRARADEVLDSSKYDYSDRSWSEQVGEWIGDFLDWLFGGFDGPEADAGASGGGGGWLSWLSWLVIVLAVVALAFYIGRVVASGRLRGSGRRRRGRQEDAVVEEVMTRTSDQWRAEAERHEAEGRWRDGILCRFRSLVVELGDRRVLDEVVGLTAGELRREVALRAPAAADPFDSAAGLFEDVWYGGAPAGPDERDRFTTLAERAITTAAAEPVPVPGPAPAVTVTEAAGEDAP